ncbi:phage portal protein [Alphaproteobacteria bacterium]|nr:phage portal protein [Alphaproteobacteria bacterium]GHS98851.1 phage portal protein [Alphaproteobacteria bacterium]
MKFLNSVRKIFRRKPLAASYESAGTGRRLQRWVGSQGSINSVLLSDLETLQTRSRDAVRNNPYAANILDVLTTNAIGTGIKPQSLSKDKSKIDALWLAWTDEADADNQQDFYGLQSLILRGVIESGECFVRFKMKRDQAVPLQLQVLESEFLENETALLPNGNRLVGGIELNPQGRRIAYHLHKTYPGDSSVEADDVVRIPASEILHIYKPLRPGQVRGEPWLARVLLKLHDLDQYDDAELVRKKTTAMFAGFITRLDPETSMMGEGDTNSAGQAFAGLEPGTMQFLEPGEDVRFSQPGDVGGTYQAFMSQQLRSVAVGMGITYEQLTGDLSGVNYSSIRAGLVEFRRRISMIQHHLMVFQLCRPVWDRWFELAILNNQLLLNADPKVKWIPQGFDWVDPLKDIHAQVLSIQNGLRSRAEIVSERGYDVEDIDKEIAADNERAKKLGLVFEYPSKIEKSEKEGDHETSDD